MSSPTIILNTSPPIAAITLNRPSSGNAIDEQTAFALRDACEQVTQNDDIWVVIVTANGDVFCSGTDATDLRNSDGFEMLRSLKVADSVAAVDKPVIAALNGDAIDQGLEMALACDIRVASRNARFGLTQVKSGMIPWDGGTQRLPRLIGKGRAMEIILTSRLIDAQEALGTGLVNETTQPEQVLPRAKLLASTIANHGPIAARYLKETVLKGLDMTLEQGLRLEADLNFILQSTSDRAEGIGSFLEKRTPEYRGE